MCRPVRFERCCCHCFTFLITAMLLTRAKVLTLPYKGYSILQPKHKSHSDLSDAMGA